MGSPATPPELPFGDLGKTIHGDSYISKSYISDRRRVGLKLLLEVYLCLYICLSCLYLIGLEGVKFKVIQDQIGHYFKLFY